MGEGESPETEIGRGVGDASEGELDCVDRLVDHDVAEIELQIEVSPSLPSPCLHAHVRVLLQRASAAVAPPAPPPHRDRRHSCLHGRSKPHNYRFQPSRLLVPPPPHNIE